MSRHADPTSSDVSSDEVDTYLLAPEEPKRGTLQKLRATILEIVPDAEQVISYRVPAFRVRGQIVAGHDARRPGSVGIGLQLSRDREVMLWRLSYRLPADAVSPDPGEESPIMPAKTKTESDGFSVEERAAMRQRAAELRAEGKKGAKKADALQAALDSIAAMAPDDRALAERVHAAVTSAAPELSPKTWYGMPAYANEDGKVVVFFKDAGKFKSRYATLGFEEAANLDDGPMWSTSYALTEWTPAVEKKVVALVKAAAS